MEWLKKDYGPETYNKSVESNNKEVLFIQTGSTKGTTFKINVDRLVFSSLFNTGVQVSCIKYNTIAALGLVNQIADNNINKNKIIAVVSQVVMDDRIMVAHQVKIPVRKLPMVPPKCSNMFSGRVKAHPCKEFKNKFPKPYVEPIQYDNKDVKWQDVIPYMIINLDYDRDIYISKDHHSICKGRRCYM